MPAATHAAVGSKKRKSVKDGSSSSKRRAVATDSNEDATMSKITELEIQISESRKHYNNIATLLSMLDVGKNAQNPNLPVAVSLCRVFSRLIAAGSLTESSRADDNEKLIVAWLKERFQEYQKALVTIMREGDASAQVCIYTVAGMSEHSLMGVGHGIDSEHETCRRASDTYSQCGQLCLVFGSVQERFRGRHRGAGGTSTAGGVYRKVRQGLRRREIPYIHKNFVRSFSQFQHKQALISTQRIRLHKANNYNPRNPHHHSLSQRLNPRPLPLIRNLPHKNQFLQQKTRLRQLPQKARAGRLALRPIQQPLPIPTQIPPPHDGPPHRALVHPPRTPHGLPHRLVRSRRRNFPPRPLGTVLPHS